MPNKGPAEDTVAPRISPEADKDVVVSRLVWKSPVMSDAEEMAPETASEVALASEMSQPGLRLPLLSIVQVPAITLVPETVPPRIRPLTETEVPRKKPVPPVRGALMLHCADKAPVLSMVHLETVRVVPIRAAVAEMVEPWIVPPAALTNAADNVEP